VKPIRRFPRNLLVKPTLALALLTAATCARAQTPAATPQPSPAQPTVTQQAPASDADGPASNVNAAAENDAAQKRLARARSLAAIGRLAAAVNELESLRAATADESVRDVARVLLMSICVEMPDYARAAALLDESFRARTPGQTGDAATHTYFALAGQTINSVRTHLERYRSFGVNVSDASELTAEAGGDLEQVRGLLEKVAGQAKSLHEEQIKGGEEGTRGLDAAALLEDAATVRTRLARNDQDRAQWQTVVSEAREHLFSSEMRIASISELPNARTAAKPAPSPTPAASTPAANRPATAAANKSARGPLAQKSQGGEEKQPPKKSRKSDAGSGQKLAASSGAQPSTGGQASAPPQQAGNAQQSPAPAGDAKKSEGGPVSVGSLAGKAKQRVSPAYPQIARMSRVSGIVTVYLVVNEKGEVEKVERADGPAQLQQAATDAARRWKFLPTVVDGQPVRVTGYLSFNFSL
jgi:periplasmic protein TonB